MSLIRLEGKNSFRTVRCNKRCRIVVKETIQGVLFEVDLNLFGRGRGKSFHVISGIKLKASSIDPILE